MKKSIWITWEDQRRNRELSNALGIELYEFKDIDKIQNRLWKYLLGLLKTIKILYKKRPLLIFCQNPSIVLSLFLVLVKDITKSKVIVDAHNSGIFPAEGNSRILMLFSRFIQRRANMVIVTNDGLKRHVLKNGGSAFVLEDKIPLIQKRQPVSLEGRINILYICSFSEDEPFETVFQAAAGLPADLAIYVSGDYKKLSQKTLPVPDQIHFTGYIPTEEFEQLLCSVDCTMDLTNREDCLVCGAYESLAAGKPMILSDTRALRRYFDRGVVYTLHTTESIRDAIFQFLRERADLENQVIVLRNYLEIHWELRKKKLVELIATFK